MWCRNNEWRKLCKEHADLEIIVTAYREYKKVLEDLEANKEMIKSVIIEEKDKFVKTLAKGEKEFFKEYLHLKEIIKVRY